MSQEKKRVAPPDGACDKAWDEIMKIAEEHCLIAEAYGGVAVLITPENQRKGGLRRLVLDAHEAVEGEA